MDGNELTRVVLPPNSVRKTEEWVEVKDRLKVRDLASISNLVNGGDQAVASVFRYIASWSFKIPNTAEPLPLIFENFLDWETEDYSFLRDWINNRIAENQQGLDPEEKKASTASSQAPETEADQTIAASPKTSIPIN